jgi:hypothetical protein
LIYGYTVLNPSTLMAEYSARPTNRLDIFIVVSSLRSRSKITNNPSHESVFLEPFTKPSRSCLIGERFKIKCPVWRGLREMICHPFVE